MFRFLFLVVWPLVHLYLAWRAASIPFVRARASRRAVFAGVIALGFLPFLTRRFGASAPHGLVVGVEAVASTWIGISSLVFATFLVVEIATLFGFAFRDRAPRWRGWALVVAVALAGVGFAQGLRAPVVERHEVRLAGLPAALDGTRAVVLSDTHLGVLLGPDWLAGRVDQILAERPDLILLTGDIVEGRVHPALDEALSRQLSRLRAPLGTWGVPGNHEAHAGGAPAVRFLEAAGVRLLRDAWREAAPGLVLAGTDDERFHRDGPSPEARLADALAGRPGGAATVLLSHRPRRAEQAAAAGVGLMLAGHTHAGQIWPFSLLAAVEHPLFAGRYDVDGMTVLVSRGAGTWGPRMRLWRRADILSVVLRAP
jgi:predicted MPP superfamily phosphohydrolase